MFSIANPLLKSVVFAAFVLLAGPQDASAITLKAGETYKGTFDLTGFVPAYDPAALSGYNFAAQYLTDGQNTLDTILYSAGGSSEITAQLFANFGAGGEGTFGNDILGSDFYWIIQGLAGEVVFNATITQGRNTRPAIFSLVAPVAISAALPLLAAGLAANRIQACRKRQKSVIS